MTLTLDPRAPVGEIARDHPELIPLLDRLRIDYCCHGNHSLDDACRRAGVDPSSITRGPADHPTRPAPTPVSLTMTQLSDHIEAVHHTLAREVFQRTDTIMPRVLAAHRASHPEFEKLDRELAGLREEMLDHMVREERVLFPWLRRLEEPGAVHIGPPWSVQRPIDCMKHDHDSVAEAFDRIRTITNDYTPPSDACTTVRALFELLREFEIDTRHHIHKENNILFPAAMEAEARTGRSIQRTASGACSHAAVAPAPTEV